MNARMDMKVGLLALALTGILYESVAEQTSPSFWAVLVAGSKGWENYRHQADLCHAYQALVAKGVPKERIIIMMYDDIANNSMNSKKGVIINQPNGSNVYEGVQIDYRENDVSVDIFRNVLLGNKTAVKGRGTGRVLESGKHDHVLINFVDHGTTGCLSFPNEYLYAKDLIEIFKKMQMKQNFGKLLMFVEACEAGSMFDNILKPYENILVTTASAPDESSWAWYCDEGTCLGDLYSVAWISRLEKLNSTESLFENFDAIRTKVLQKSHVNMYGDYRIGYLQFGKFIGNIHNAPLTDTVVEHSNLQGFGVDNRDVPIYLAKMELEKSNSQQTEYAEFKEDYKEKEKKLQNLLMGRMIADNVLSKIVDDVVKGNISAKSEIEKNRIALNDEMFDCYKALVSSFDAHCFKATEHYYFLKHFYKFANICVKKLEVTEVIAVMQKTCSSLNFSGTII